MEKIGQTAAKPRQLQPAAIALGAAKDLLPGYFALVMATGIVSVAARQEGLLLFAKALLGVNWLAYGILWALTFLRIAVFSRQFIGDLSSHRRGAGFFTLAAATCVLGAQTLEISGAEAPANALWWIGLSLWFVVMYAFFTAVTVRRRKPPLGKGLSGAWLVAAVATQSIVVLRGALDAKAAPIAEIQFLCLALFFAGCFIYLSIIPLILYRLTFLDLSPDDFSPPYWINMGAVAITALAGSTLVQRADVWPVLKDFGPFLKGITLFFWAAGAWWIPLLAALEAWRHLIRGDALAYDPRLWSMVFPLGMYTASTFDLSRALNLPFLMAIPHVFLYIAIAAWAATAFGLLVHLWRACRASRAA